MNRFGRLVVIEQARLTRHRARLWRCPCDCGEETLADTGKDMNAKYKETSEAGLAANLVLC